MPGKKRSGKLSKDYSGSKLEESPHNFPHSRNEPKKLSLCKALILNGGRGGDRTHNHRLRRPVLYPIELLAHMLYRLYRDTHGSTASELQSDITRR